MWGVGCRLIAGLGGLVSKLRPGWRGVPSGQPGWEVLGCGLDVVPCRGLDSGRARWGLPVRTGLTSLRYQGCR